MFKKLGFCLLASFILSGCQSTAKNETQQDTKQAELQKILDENYKNGLKLFVERLGIKKGKTTKIKVVAPNPSALEVGTIYVKQAGAVVTDGDDQKYTLEFSHKKDKKCNLDKGTEKSRDENLTKICGNFPKITVFATVTDNNGEVVIAGSQRLREPKKDVWEARYKDGAIYALANFK